jgi:hypothetical protein
MQKKRRLLKLIISAAFLVLAGTGCSTTTIPQYKGETSKQARTVEVQGLAIVVDPIVDKERADTYFKVDPPGRKIAIIYLQAENKSTNCTWLLTEESIHLVWGAKQQTTNACDFTNIKDGDYAAANSLAYSSLPFAFVPVTAPIAIALISASSHSLIDATIMQRNFVEKEWLNQTLSPGQKAQGFVYFNLEGQPDWAKSGSLRIDCLDTRSQQTSTLNIPFSNENK